MRLDDTIYTVQDEAAHAPGVVEVTNGIIEELQRI